MFRLAFPISRVLKAARETQTGNRHSRDTPMPQKRINGVLRRPRSREIVPSWAYSRFLRGVLHLYDPINYAGNTSID